MGKFFIKMAVLIVAAGLVLAACANPSGGGSNTGGNNTGGNDDNTGNEPEMEEVFNGTPASEGATKPLSADALLAQAGIDGISKLSDLTAAGGELRVNDKKVDSGSDMIQPTDTVKVLMPKENGGNDTGGNNTGGNNTGGNNTGGNNTGGNDTGGNNTGGNNTGGNDTGGNNTGGNNTGGNNTGNSDDGDTDDDTTVTFTPPTKAQIQEFLESHRTNTANKIAGENAAVYIKSITVNTYTIGGTSITTNPAAVAEDAEVQVKFTVRTHLDFDLLIMGERMQIDNYRVALMGALQSWLKQQGFKNAPNITTGNTVFG